MLPSLALDLSGLVVTLRDGGGKIAIGRDHDQCLKESFQIISKSLHSERETKTKHVPF